MTDNKTSRRCPIEGCLQPPTYVWVMSDPHYGYGHGAVLYCDQHQPASAGYDSKHKYDPDHDDYFLGLSKVHLDWMASGGTKKLICYDCKSEIPPDDVTEHKDGSRIIIRYGYNRIGHGLRLQHVVVNGELRSKFKEELHYCRKHFIERHRTGKADVDVIEK